ncbi:MAG TPA: heavy metal translocating P-type ATPase [Candidatus Hydrogenedentes bacterium]|nr:heavy metal translocating P-type ATPase [Candidatus Hydrogenedentota bacterium]HOL76584.1 heavy metal translocating P-type ATPase [Candidatus Hydrogenedentota bacterium]HPO84417.1 heavy metal translocating P-type ATPase [Candidatus Hydrogenedentota bacterium]
MQEEETGVIDPICGMTVFPSKARFSCERNGETYYFCSEYCLKKFRESSTVSPRTDSLAHSQTGTTYFCPMCPDVRQETPGACPHCGMSLQPESADAGISPEYKDMQRRLWLGVVLTFPIVLLAMGEMSSQDKVFFFVPRYLSPWIQFALATAVLIWSGQPIFLRAVQSVRNHSWNMFTLIGLGSSVAYLVSVVGLFVPHVFPETFLGHHGQVPIYFEAAAVIVTLVILGQVIELRARLKTGDAIRSLLEMVPAKAHVISSSGSEADVPLDKVCVGDKLRVLPGERVPVDGTIVEGFATIDESAFTGESIPVEKSPGDAVIGGSMNGMGAFVMIAERVGSDTLLAQIIQTVRETQRSRAPIQRTVDKVAAFFVPAVVGISMLAFVVWLIWGPEPRFSHALLSAVSVLIIACPCALGLATPMSIMVAVGVGARHGILVRKAEVFELLSRVDTLVMDKTGTLTEGKPKLVSVINLAWCPQSELLALAAGLEQSSEHPLAGAIVQGVRARGVALPASAESFSYHPGKGVEGIASGRKVVLGNRRFLEEQNVVLTELDRQAEILRQEGQTVVYVAVDGRPAGILGIADSLRVSAPEAVQILQKHGIQVIMATGDNLKTAQTIASQLRITEVYSDLLPNDKRDIVLQLKKKGQKVAMAGDGVNDAPALACADVGLAMGTGAALAVESAGVTVLRGDVLGIVKAYLLSRATVRNVWENLFFAFAYNLVCVPVAAGVLYPYWGIVLNPMFGAFAMSFSSVSVVLNALRLRKVKLNVV